MATVSLTDAQRSLIHDLALDARSLLTREAMQLLEGVYGLHAGGNIELPENLPQVRSDPDSAETYRRLAQLLQDETQAGLHPEEVVEKLVKEVAFTHLNRLVAFKMMEARKLIRSTLERGHDSNAFKYYLADPANADDFVLFKSGQVDMAYQHFLLWQAGQIASEVRVLFDPDNLPSRLFPRPRILEQLLRMLNREEMLPCWLADETIGWVYQYFNEPELQAAFEKVRISGAKFEAKDIPSATQLFTPHWIVRFLIQNTLGQLWTRIHPDTELLGTELLDYLVPSQGEVADEQLRQAKDITLLDPACGAMHFGLVAFDLFYAMYEEEIKRAGEPNWPDKPSVGNINDIPAMIISDNLFGIDIDLRAVQLAAFALYLKAKSYNPKAAITDTNLAVADVLPLSSPRLGAFVREAHFTRPIYERVIRALWERLQDVQQLGSLLRLEQEIAELIAHERSRYQQAPLFAGIEGEFEAEATTEDFWEYLDAQIVQALDEFARQQSAQGTDLTFFTGEAVKGLRLLDVMLRRYDVVVTNPPYLSKRKMNKELSSLLDDQYPEGKGDFYAAFIQRNLEFAQERGFVGMLTMHSFMFISSYETLRRKILEQASIHALIHCGPALFEVGNPGTLQTSAFVLRKEPENLIRMMSEGIYYRAVHAVNGDEKRIAFEQSLRDGSNIYQVAQLRFEVIPRSPWTYWLPEEVRTLFETLPALSEIAVAKTGINTGYNERFVRFNWELGNIASTYKNWRPYVSGGPKRKYYGNLFFQVNWSEEEMSGYSGARLIAKDYHGREGLTYGLIGSGGPTMRYLPPGYIFSSGGNCIFPTSPQDLFELLGLLNSNFAIYLLKVINPTINLSAGDVANLPVKLAEESVISDFAIEAVHFERLKDTYDEVTIDYTVPVLWPLDDRLPLIGNRLTQLEAQIDDNVCSLYGISEEHYSEIKAQLTGEELSGEAEDHETFDLKVNDEEDISSQSLTSYEELAVRLISFAVGIILGRFRPGIPGTAGSAIYRRSDFAVGSLLEPSLIQFEQLVGSSERFAYVDKDGGFHTFSLEVEIALRNLALDDGVAVLDERHPHDLPTLVSLALALMLGDDASREVITKGASGNLRKFLEKDFFTNWHLKWYRKRPIYWPIQSAKRSYGFVLLHEKIDRSTLYTLQRDYLDHKLNGLSLQIEDLNTRKQSLSGTALKQLEREIDRLAQTLTEIQEFANTIARIVSEGYEPDPNWIDDGVILRMAPLWELIPIWKTEPKKYWDGLQKGEFDWSHIAMNYWPDRVREKCRRDKSFAIAHGLESVYQGG